VQTVTYTTIDKSEWLRGEWDNEPDKMQWQDEETGLPCLAVRGPGGHWCGYVGVPEGHPYFEKDYDDCTVDVHGGLTFADHCQEVESECTGVCHKPGDGEQDNVWWLGFDCAHCYDLSPTSESFRRQLGWSASGGCYRTLTFVQAEAAKLAEQLTAVSA
jgi:hypothetical protein